MDTKNKDLLISLKSKFESAQRFLYDLVQENANKLSNLVETNYQLGLYHLRANNLRDAELRFRIVLYFRPKHHLALYNLAKCYVSKNQKYSAIEKLKIALGEYQDFPEAEYLLHTLEKSSKIEQIPPSVVQEYYDNIAHYYNDKFSSKKGHKTPEYMSDLLSLHYTSKDGDTNILDLGCGTGKCSKAVAEQLKYKSITGVDISKNMLKEAQKITKNKSPLFDKLIHLDFNDFMNKSSSKFNVILAGMSLHFKKDLEKPLKQISNLLAKEGLLVFSIEQSAEGSNTVISSSYENFCYTESTVRKHVKEANLSISALDEISLNNGQSILVILCKK
jgi:predicted TPR repeat methyltransferase